MAGGSTANGAGATQRTTTNATDQQWRFVQQSSGFFKIFNVASGKVLGVENRSTATAPGSCSGTTTAPSTTNGPSPRSPTSQRAAQAQGSGLRGGQLKARCPSRRTAGRLIMSRVRGPATA
ncbi:RICIN domain-containing protein [Streptomyces sp. NPDC057474]|uniref:RICIN domain-containing protein n=1 Tax=Streptomyces sp. NPDC057474 TaxID=3346144 RepID=UPI0036A3E107